MPLPGPEVDLAVRTLDLTHVHPLDRAGISIEVDGVLAECDSMEWTQRHEQCVSASPCAAEYISPVSRSVEGRSHNCNFGLPACITALSPEGVADLVM